MQAGERGRSLQVCGTVCHIGLGPGHWDEAQLGQNRCRGWQRVHPEGLGPRLDGSRYAAEHRRGEVPTPSMRRDGAAPRELCRRRRLVQEKAAGGDW